MLDYKKGLNQCLVWGVDVAKVEFETEDWRLNIWREVAEREDRSLEEFIVRCVGIYISKKPMRSYYDFTLGC